MKRIITLTALLLFFAAGFTACQKIEKDTPPAIKKLIREKYGFCVSVIECRCNEKVIYCFVGEPGIDGQSYIFDEDGNRLCNIGGVAGDMCKEYENRVEIRVIWTKK
jgi:hypothetical protein